MIRKAWQPLNEASLHQVPAHLGVFELSLDGRKVCYIGVADARTRFGLRERLEQQFVRQSASYFRLESTQAYSTRFKELLMLHQARYGQLPELNQRLGTPLPGRLSPWRA